jgi:hypothetical protein
MMLFLREYLLVIISSQEAFLMTMKVKNNSNNLTPQITQEETQDINREKV